MSDRKPITCKPGALPCPACGYLIDVKQLDSEFVTCSECGQEHQTASVRHFYTSGAPASSSLYDRFVPSAVLAQAAILLVAFTIVCLSIPISTQTIVYGLLFAAGSAGAVAIWIRLVYRAMRVDPRVSISTCVGAHVAYFLALLSIAVVIGSVAILVGAFSFVALTRGLTASLGPIIIGIIGAGIGVLLWMASEWLERFLTRRCRHIELESEHVARTD